MSSRIYGAKDSLQIRVICGAQDSGCPGAMTRMALALWHSRHLDVALGAGGTEKKGKSFSCISTGFISLMCSWFQLVLHRLTWKRSSLHYMN